MNGFLNENELSKPQKELAFYRGDFLKIFVEITKKITNHILKKGKKIR
jgi:hypothetical protein